MENNIQNKVIVITGASSGLGEETAKYLAENCITPYSAGVLMLINNNIINNLNLSI